MKIIIAGSRGITDPAHIDDAVDHSPWGEDIFEIVSGTARGVDQLGEQYAEECGVRVTQFPADWDGKGRGAGYIRNREMAVYADALISVWDGVSKGSLNMIVEMVKLNKSVFIWPVTGV